MFDSSAYLWVCLPSSGFFSNDSSKFVETYDPTLEDSYRRQITVGSREVVLDIFDTAGQEDFR